MKEYCFELSDSIAEFLGRLTVEERRDLVPAAIEEWRQRVHYGLKRIAASGIEENEMHALRVLTCRVDLTPASIGDQDPRAFLVGVLDAAEPVPNAIERFHSRGRINKVKQMIQQSVPLAKAILDYCRVYWAGASMWTEDKLMEQTRG